jgi:hypothetical protein
LAVVPSLVGLVFAVGAAVGWCIWLETRPEAETPGGPGRPRGCGVRECDGW